MAAGWSGTSTQAITGSGRSAGGDMPQSAPARCSAHCIILRFTGTNCETAGRGKPWMIRKRCGVRPCDQMTANNESEGVLRSRGRMSPWVERLSSAPPSKCRRARPIAHMGARRCPGGVCPEVARLRGATIKRARKAAQESGTNAGAVCKDPPAGSNVALLRGGRAGLERRGDWRPGQ
jgi:hypothetical protein